MEKAKQGNSPRFAFSKLTTQNSPLKTHHSKLTTQNSPLKTHHSKLTTQNSNCALFTNCCIG
ncbi:hypothetical protein [Anaerobacillus arseniciselenatis]|uniref:hypothetical protein n=1 Tax=Anaerobacillus arseniciselenatis TaxID=85682 RepID=UPI0014717B88|nr:hypothetical protein [Anaerobacillus arseniciselenatis]